MTSLTKHIGQGFARGELYDYLSQMENFYLTNQGQVYFVECNAGSDSNSGADWDHAFKTLAFAIGVSNTNIAAGSSGWASRNTIFLKGDACDEDLATGATKCDIVGCGSCDAQPRARILGTHAFTGSSAMMAMRFFNIEFWNDSADANLTFTTSDGIAFHNCVFTAGGGSTYAIAWVGATGNDITIENCIFRPKSDGTKFATAAILLDQVTCNGLVIRNNIIDGTVGIDIDCTNLRQAYIDNNVIRATGFVIDDESELAVVTNNKMITAGANSSETDVIQIGTGLAAGNILTGSTDTQNYPILTGDA